MDFDWLELSGETGAPAPSDEPRRKPTDGPSSHRAARELRRAGHMKTAAQYYRRAVGFQEHNYDAWTELVDTLLRARQVDEAVAAATEAVEGHGMARILYAALALARAHEGDLPDALRLSDVSLDDERRWFPLCVRGEVLLRGDAKSKRCRGDALSAFEEGVRLAQDPWDAFFLGGCALMDAGWAAHAAGYFTEAAHCQPLAAAGWFGLADAFEALRLYDQAAFYYKTAGELEPMFDLARRRGKWADRLAYGLLRAFRKETLDELWEKRFDIRSETPWEPTHNDLKIP